MRKIKISNVQALDDNFRQECINESNSCKMQLHSIEFEVQVADECPICHFGIDMSNDKWTNFHDINSMLQKEFHIISVHICPHCHNGFVVMHHMKAQKNGYAEESQSVYPTTVSNFQIDEDIRQISPDFYEIYNQCLIAKNDGLNQIYGMGFRKALERLVKDYSIYNHPEDVEWIRTNKETTLHKCIEKYFRNSDAKTALMACKWLGNNETHYENYNTDEDLQLFEDLIEDTLYYIHREIRHKRAEDINNTKGNKKL